MGRTAQKPTYHKKDLRSTLLRAAERELIDHGPEGFSLRSCAKRAGVSHAAPAHYFDSADMLLQALAASGFARLEAQMGAAVESADGTELDRFVEAAFAYIDFATDNSALFALMFGGKTVKMHDASLTTSSGAMFSFIVKTIGRIVGQKAFQTEEGWRDVTAAWSMVHGYAHLFVGNRMVYLNDRSKQEQRAFIDDMIRRVLPY